MTEDAQPEAHVMAIRHLTHEVRQVDEHVEVLGYRESDVREAVELFKAVTNERISARQRLRAHVHEAMIRNHGPSSPSLR